MASLAANWQVSELAIDSVQGSIQSTRMSAEWQQVRWGAAPGISLSAFIRV